MFCYFFLIGAHLFADESVFHIRHPARPCARNRPVIEPPPRRADQHLGRRADQRNLAHTQIEHIRRRVDHTQGAIDLKWMRDDTQLEALRENYLENISYLYVL